MSAPSPRHVQETQHMVNELIGFGDDDEAIDIVRKALVDHPDDPGLIEILNEITNDPDGVTEELSEYSADTLP